MAGSHLQIVATFTALIVLVMFCEGIADAGPFILGAILFKQRQILPEHASLRFTVFRPLIPATLMSIAAFLVFQAFRYAWTRVTTPRWNGPGKVLFLPCKTTHTRTFPKKHSFVYSYLQVGVPVDWEGCANGMVSSGVRSPTGLASWFSLTPSICKGWYSIDADGYLGRGNGHLGLRGKMNEFLRSQGVDSSRYPFAYLVTAAKFLGYHFNPVSFWYLYDSNKSLAAMILEVNNTFDERHVYYLAPDQNTSNDREDASAAKGETKSDTEPRTIFKQTWPKKFHVSPFNSRKGAYSLSANDVLSPRMQGAGPVDSTVNLISSNGHAKLVARLVSDGPAIDAFDMTPFQKLVFFASWWWVGLVTFPRICRQAFALFFQRRLYVWYRPEPLKDSIGRKADSMERGLELIFRRYLGHLVEHAIEPLAVKYIPSGISEDAGELMLSTSVHKEAPHVAELELKVLTPGFYSRFVHYAHDMEALFCEFRESCTIWVSRPELLAQLVIKIPWHPLGLPDMADFIYFKAIQCLRSRPERIERPLTSQGSRAPRTSGLDMRDLRISSMDGYVLACETPRNRAMYRRLVLKLFLADGLAMGSVPLLQVQLFAMRAMFAWFALSLLSGLMPRIMAS